MLDHIEKCQYSLCLAVLDEIDGTLAIKTGEEFVSKPEYGEGVVVSRHARRAAQNLDDRTEPCLNLGRSSRPRQGIAMQSRQLRQFTNRHEQSLGQPSK